MQLQIPAAQLVATVQHYINSMPVTHVLCCVLPIGLCSQEWEAPQPSKRPDIFPEFEKPERVFLPKPLPGEPVCRATAVLLNCW
jgi:hypothetical protein